MALLFIHALGGLHKIARAKYVGLVNACHEVGIMKTAIYHTNGHAITIIALLVHLVHTEHLHLCRRVAIIIGQRSVAFVGHFALARHHLCHRQTVGTFPHTAHALDIRQLAHPLHERGVGSFNHHRIVPLAHIVYAESQIAQSVYIGVRHGQVVRINLKSVAAAACQRFGRQKCLWVFDRETILLFVGKLHAVAVTLWQVLVDRYIFIFRKFAAIYRTVQGFKHAALVSVQRVGHVLSMSTQSTDAHKACAYNSFYI